MDKREKKITRASWVGIIGNGILAVLKVSFGLISGSLALVGDGIDSFTDIVTGFIILFAAKIMSKPPDREHPYGHHRAETIATVLLAFIIFFAGAQLIINTVSALLSTESVALPSAISIYIVIISILGKIFLAFYQYRIGQDTQSSMLIANSKNMRNDILISFGVLLGLIFTYLFNLRIFDSIAALIIALWIIKEAYDIVMETNIELMDGVEDTKICQEVFDAIDKVEGVYNPHRTRIRKMSNLFIIDTDIEVDKNLTVCEAHNIAMEVEKSIKENIKDVYDVIIHVEPLGNIEHDESFGLCEEMLDRKQDSSKESKP